MVFALTGVMIAGFIVLVGLFVTRFGVTPPPLPDSVALPAGETAAEPGKGLRGEPARGEGRVLLVEADGSAGLPLIAMMPNDVTNASATITGPDGGTIAFDVDPWRKHCLLNGLDDIGLTLQHVNEIKAFEERHRQAAPWLF